MRKALPKYNKIPKNFYHSKKSMEQLGLGCQKIHCCLKGCIFITILLIRIFVNVDFVEKTITKLLLEMVKLEMSL